MALKDLMDTLKRGGYIVKALDQYLLTSDDTGEDRRKDINSPSSASSCSRAIYYSRTGAERSGNDPRTQRIFDNGSHVHLRLQDYLSKMGILKMEEVPVFDSELETQGHCDGLIELNKRELGVLEIKSINDNGFKALKEAKSEHIMQAQVYLYCLEKWRLHLRSKYKTKSEFDKYLKNFKTRLFYVSMYKHLKDGSKYTKAQKMQFRIETHTKLDTLLWNTSMPINKMIFLYENKNDQSLAEFCVERDEKLINEMKEKFMKINNAVDTQEILDREGTSKSCNVCRFCPHKDNCFVV